MMTTTRHPALLGSLECGIAAALGFGAVVVPVLLDPTVKQYDAAFLPFVRTAIEGMKPLSMPLLFVAGAVAGLVGHQRFWLVGAVTMAAFPLWSATDLLVGILNDALRNLWLPFGSDPGGHNLLPIEWAIYALLSLLGVAGAGCARMLRHVLTGRHRHDTASWLHGSEAWPSRPRSQATAGSPTRRSRHSRRGGDW